ncbi:Sushi, von Willebrand factor type A, EGF and pentraxin domain-containing protein 1 [Liparis tanakae]|uniref:Sushi, von Willebrand factor type A, EGF and pentraxin domain-containing protein 1 n=1 Tax=Liparis tanakae TaxID=230148 RepID=A0A4Z2EQE0_9TELE|nr:Sushi, von Willebrand factor type A, EGF and pentraxin domain-containing protein 1 [Liparis tanakae]
MLFKASRCDDVDLVKLFAGEFNTKLGVMLPNICSSGDVTCKLEVTSQGHCLEYNYDYDNGFSIGRTYTRKIQPRYKPRLYFHARISFARYFSLSLFNISQHLGVGATAGGLRAPRTTPTLSRASLRAPGSWPGRSETAACGLSAPRGTGKSPVPPGTRRYRSFSTSQVYLK